MATGPSIGNCYSISILPTAHDQAIEAGQSMKKIIGDETVRWFVSPYVRTLETFRGIAESWGGTEGQNLRLLPFVHDSYTTIFPRHVRLCSSTHQEALN